MTTATMLAARQRRTYAHRSASTIFRSASRLKPSTTENSRRPVVPSMLHHVRRYQDAWRPQSDACARRIVVSTMGPNAPLRRPRPSIIRRFLPSKYRNLGTRKEGHTRPSRRRDGRPKAAALVARKCRRRITSRRIAESRCRQPRRGCRRRHSAWSRGQ